MALSPSPRTSIISNVMSWLRTNTSLTSVQKMPQHDWASFGPVAAFGISGPTITDIGSEPEDMMTGLRRVIGETLEKIDRSNVMLALQKVGSALKRKVIDGGPSLDVIRNSATQKDVAAVRVVTKLTPRKIDETFNRSLEADMRRAQASLTAERYRTQMAVFSDNPKDQAPPFDSWQDFRFVVSTLPLTGQLGHHGVAGIGLDKGELVIGGKLITVNGRADEALTMMRDLLVAQDIPINTSKGELLAPSAPPSEKLKDALRQYFVFDNALRPGTDILIRDNDLVRARRVHPSLELGEFEARMAGRALDGVRTAERELALAAGDKERATSAARLEEARARHVLTRYANHIDHGAEAIRQRQKVSEPETVDVVPPELDIATGFGSDDFAYDNGATGQNRNAGGEVFIRYTEGEPHVFERAPAGTRFEGGVSERLCVEFRALSELPDGEYEVETADEFPDGTLTMQDGSISGRRERDFLRVLDATPDRALAETSTPERVSKSAEVVEEKGLQLT